MSVHAFEQIVQESHLKYDDLMPVAPASSEARDLDGYIDFWGRDITGLATDDDSAPHIVLDIGCGAAAAVRDLNNVPDVVAFGIELDHYEPCYDPDHVIIGDVSSTSGSTSGRTRPAYILPQIPDSSISLVVNTIGAYPRTCGDDFIYQVYRMLKENGHALLFTRSLTPAQELELSSLMAEERMTREFVSTIVTRDDQYLGLLLTKLA